jgi:hypothetical protein
MLQVGCEACAARVETYKILSSTHYYVFDVGGSGKKYRDSPVAVTLGMFLNHTAFLAVI